MARLLFISHHFPPDTSIGSKRSHRIAAEMARRGFEVDVLCAELAYQDGCDPALLEGLQGVAIHRTEEWNPRVWARRALAGKRAAAGDVAGAGAGAGATPAPASASAAASAPAWAALRSLGRGWRQLAEVPDEWGGWLPFAMAAAMRLPRPDVVLATTPPSTSVVVGAAIAAQLGVPLVLDYRDPWSSRARRAHLPAARRILEDRLERSCLHKASAVVAVSAGMAREIGALAGRHVHVVPNAAEPGRLAAVEPAAFARPTLVYTGGLYGGRSVTPVLDALAALRAAGRPTAALPTLRVMGHGHELAIAEADARGVGDLVLARGPGRHTEALAWTRGAGANLLLVAPEHVRQVPAKVFEQLAAGRPILAIAPAGADAFDVLRDVAGARCVSADDRAGVMDALVALAEGAWTGEVAVPAAYTVARTMDRLAAILDRARGAQAAPARARAVTIAATGDLMLPPDVVAALAPDPVAAMGPVAAALRAADVAFGNLETPLVVRAVAQPSPNPLQPVFTAPAVAAHWLRAIGYDVLHLANNHITDAGPLGVVETVAACREAGLLSFGAGGDLAEARRPVVVDVDGVLIGFIGYASYVSAGPTSPGCAPMHPDRIVADIRRLRREVDHVVVSLHSGIEYAELPMAGFRRLCHDAIEAGAALVLGHHAHVYQGHERVGAGLIVYCLGNALADTAHPETKRLAFERTFLRTRGLADLADDDPRLEDVVVAQVTLSAAPPALALALHRIGDDLRIGPASAADAARFEAALAAQLAALARDDPRMEELDAAIQAVVVGNAMQPANLLRNARRIRPHHVRLGLAWLARRSRS